jgi:hypothetical protein
MKSFRAGLLGCLGVGAAIVLVIIVIAVIASGGKSTGGSPLASPASTENGQTTASTPSPSHAPVVLLDFQGNGIKQSPKFVAPREWSITYNWSCSNGFSFDMYIEGDTSDVVSNSNSSGNDTTYEHSGGSVYLSVNSGECNWHVVAKG